MKKFGGLQDGGEGQAGALGDVEQRVLAVGKIQNPKARVDFGCRRGPAGGPIEAAATELRFAKRLEVAKAAIGFQDVEDGGADSERLKKRVGIDEAEVVGGGVILRESAPDAAHGATDIEIETGRTVLALVVAVGREIKNFGTLAEMRKNVGGGTIYLGAAVAGLFIVKGSFVADAGED